MCNELRDWSESPALGSLEMNPGSREVDPVLILAIKRQWKKVKGRKRISFLHILLAVLRAIL